MLAEARRDALGIEKERVDVRMRQKFAESFENTLASAHSEQPVVNDGAAHLLMSGLGAREHRRPYVLSVAIEPKLLMPPLAGVPNHRSHFEGAEFEHLK